MSEPIVYHENEQVALHLGDCLHVLAGIPDSSIDAVVCDPPYSLSFMGREWDSHDTPRDFQAWCETWATECLRVLKPGGHLLAFGSPRTYHRLASGIEDAGFEIRDSIHWIYGSGMPKGQNIGKAIDKAAGADRAVVGQRDRYLDGHARRNLGDRNQVYGEGLTANGVADITLPATIEATVWEGWNTQLKPAHEPIIVARKSTGFNTTVANVLEHGTGALNIDTCRTEVLDDAYARNASGDRGHAESRDRQMGFAQTAGHANDLGRWPTNVVFGHGEQCADTCAPGCPVTELDAQSGTLSSGANPTRRGSDKFRATYGQFEGSRECVPARGADSGGASRFFPVFRYEAKAPAHERPKLADGTQHTTVKPLELMRWLVRLVTPMGGGPSRSVRGKRHDTRSRRPGGLQRDRRRTRTVLRRPVRATSGQAPAAHALRGGVMARHVPAGPVGWRTARLGEPLPCVVCGRPALLRHPVTQRPHRKVCDPDTATGAA